MTSMDDKTVETQAKKVYETIIEELENPPEKVLCVLSDNTASVSTKKGGCVTLLQEKLRHKLTGTREPDVDQPTRGGRGSRGRRGRGARGGGSDPSGRGGTRAAGRRGCGTSGGRSGICGRGLGRGTRGAVGEIRGGKRKISVGKEFRVYHRVRNICPLLSEKMRRVFFYILLGPEQQQQYRDYDFDVVKYDTCSVERPV